MRTRGHSMIQPKHRLWCSRLAAVSVLALLAIGGVSVGRTAPPPADKESDLMLSMMQTELDRAKTSLAKADPAPYYISYDVYDQRSMTISGTYGTVLSSNQSTRRFADVTMRVGKPDMD